MMQNILQLFWCEKSDNKKMRFVFWQLSIGCLSSWWLNQPIWKICSSKWVHFPQFSGWKCQKIFELPPASYSLSSCVSTDFRCFCFSSPVTGWSCKISNIIAAFSAMVVHKKHAFSAARKPCKGKFHPWLSQCVSFFGWFGLMVVWDSKALLKGYP